MEAKRTRHAVYNIPYHLVWCPKYQRKVFANSVAERWDQLIRSKVMEPGGEAVVLEVQPTPVHLFAGFSPTLVVYPILHRIKGFTFYAFCQVCSWLKRQISSLWTRSYYVGTVGEVAAETTRRRIKAQQGCHAHKER